MRNKLFYTAAFTLAIAFSNLTAYANTINKTERSPYITRTVAFPYWNRPSIASHVRHTFRLQIPQGSTALTQLNIDVPDGLTVRNDINVSDQSGREIKTNTSVKGNKVTLAFLQPVSPATRLEINMNNVNILGVSNVWVYRVSAKFAGIDTDMQLGIAQFSVY